MATPVQMPKVGISVESCILTKWHKKKGDSVKVGETLFTYETDKTTVDEEAPAGGILLDVFYAEGDDVPVMKYVAVIGEAGESVAAFAPEKVEEPKPAEPLKAEPATEPAVFQKPKTLPATVDMMPGLPADGKAGVSPRARKLAEKTGVDARLAVPTGAENRIVERDVAALAERATGVMAKSAAPDVSGSGIGGRLATFDAGAPAAQPAAADAAAYTDEKLSGIRKAIARTMLESISGMAQLTHNSSFDATEILNYRAKLKNGGEGMGLPNITLNDMILFAVSRILLEHKYLNAHFLGDGIRLFRHANIGVAVDTERGLLVPTLFAADTMTLSEIAASAKSLARAAQSGSIAPDLLKGGTFTVSNLGALGIESFTPIINPPQTAILGVNCIRDAIRVVNGEVRPYKAMTLSLTYDHRAVDGAPASRFLKDLCDALEHFQLLLAK